tara:strand:- start:649 stop:987 length:339 start_codon:yes stop_codon:yes gene_type:complete
MTKITDISDDILSVIDNLVDLGKLDITSIDKLKRPEQVHYCKELLKDNKPIIVKDLITGKETYTDLWRKLIYDEKGGPWLLIIRYIPGVKDKSGARVKLMVVPYISTQTDAT